MATRRTPRQAARRRASATHSLSSKSFYRRPLRFEPLEDRRLLALVTVTTTGDTIDFNDGLTSLREAIFATNLVGGPDTIDFAPSLTAGGIATILLTQGELKITDDLTIDGPGANLLTIDASGNDPTPDQHNGDGTRVLTISGPGTINVGFSGITLTGGDVTGSGGAIFNVGENLTVSTSNVENNAAMGSSQSGRGGAIYSTGGKLVIDSSTIDNNYAARAGGGIDASGTLIVTNSQISNNKCNALEGGGVRLLSGSATFTKSIIEHNSGAMGGGIASGANTTLTIADSTISGNVVTGQGFFSQGGGVLSLGYSTITNSTISNNNAPGGLGSAVFHNGIANFLVTPSLIISNSTISGNGPRDGGGSLYANRGRIILRFVTVTGNSSGLVANLINQGAFTVRSSIVTGNKYDDLNLEGGGRAFSSLGYNIVGVGSSEALANFNKPGDQVGVIDPMLGPLADNGGPTMTHALLPGSPAINAGDLNAVAGVNGVPLYDQRGEPFGRVFNGRIDIGAFEYQQPSDLNLLVDTLSDESDGNYARYDLSLREAIELANLYPSVDTIHFDPALTASGTATILLTKGDLTIKDDLTIAGPGSSLLTIDASGNDDTPGVFDSQGSRVFKISDGKSSRLEVSIGGVRLTGADAQLGAVNSDENLHLDEVVVEQNAGSLYVVQSTGRLTMDRSQIVNNTVLSTQSGASALNTSEATIRDSEISFNSRGGITAGVGEGGTILIADTTIADNAGIGASVKSFTNFQLLGSTMADNVGGGLSFIGGGTVLIDDSTFARNVGLQSSGAVGGGFGGAFISTSGVAAVTVRNSSFFDNRAPIGAGLTVLGSVAVVDSEFRGNMITGSTGDGGGLLILSNGLAPANYVITGSTFAENVATRGGGLFITLANNRTATLSDNTFIANTADSQGGGLAISATGGAATINRTTIHGNHSAVLAGGLWVNATGTSRIRVENSTIDGNSSRSEGGGGTITAGNSAEVTFLQTTISGNSSTGSGGGLAVNASSTSTVSIAHSTITKNGFGQGGGISNNGNGVLRIAHSIIADNFGTSTSPDLRGTASNLNVSFSLIGRSNGSGLTPAPVGLPDANGNLIGGTTAATAINPRLASLADNGGTTETHALLANSPALNAGDPAAVPGEGGVPVHDQRGVPFIRIYGGRIDMGAIENQPTDRILGDYNGDNVVDAGDYFVWRSTVGSATDMRADGNGDGAVDDADRAVWMANFGESYDAESTSVAVALPSANVVAAQASSVALRREAPPLVESESNTKRRVLPAQRESVTEANVERHDSALVAWLASNKLTSSRRNEPAVLHCVAKAPIEPGAGALVALDKVFDTLGVTKRRLGRVG